MKSTYFRTIVALGLFYSPALVFSTATEVSPRLSDSREAHRIRGLSLIGEGATMAPEKARSVLGRVKVVRDELRERLARLQARILASPEGESTLQQLRSERERMEKQEKSLSELMTRLERLAESR